MEGITRTPADIHVELPHPHAHTESLLWELSGIIRSEWSYLTRTEIKEIKTSSNRNSSLIIEWNEADKSSVLGGYAASLLKHGWGITGIKTFYTFVAPIKPTLESGVEYRFEGSTGPARKLNAYRPKVCEACGENEHAELVKVWKKPEQFEKRLEDDEYIPREWSEYFRLCTECEIPEEHEEYEDNEEGPNIDFDPSEYPEYDYPHS
jgi:hypothetical protein